MSSSELLEVITTHAQRFVEKGIIAETDVDAYHKRAKLEADTYSSAFGVNTHGTRYVQAFTGCLLVAWQKHMTRILSSIDWASKVRVCMTNGGMIKIVDPIADDIKEILNICNKRIAKLNGINIEIDNTEDTNEEDSDQ
jgi:hypothetical protein